MPRRSWAELRGEIRRIAGLAAPVALAELGWMSMTTVDTIMIGPLGPAAIGAIGIGSSAFYTFSIFGMGLLLGLDTLVSHAFGAGDRRDCHRSLMQGIYLALLVTPPLMLLFLSMPPLFYRLGINPEVSRLAGQFLVTLSLSTLPLLLYGAQRRYLQAIGHVRPVMFALVSANLVNWLFNWLLIRGHWGFRPLGVVGSALSTCLARVYMAVALAGFIWWYERGVSPGLRSMFGKPDLARLRRLVHIGLPAAGTILLEIGAFGAAGVLAGRLTPIALAAHQIALNCAAVSYMIPLGTSSAAAVAVGHAIGARRPERARRAGFIATGLACVFVSLSAVLFVIYPRPILRIYTADPGVIAQGTGLLALAACFQLFDGIQTVVTGALRGLGQTRIPMLVNLGGYWAIGLPAGYVLCFHYGFGVYGLWCGLTLALVIIALILLHSWQRESRALVSDGLTRWSEAGAPVER
jgi:multidrug resistance protein, MATE family